MSWLTAIQPLVAGVFAVLGALVGGSISFFTVRSSERRAGAREDQLRWIRDLRNVGADLVSRCHDLEDAALLLHKSREPGREPLSASRRSELYGELFDARRNIVRSTTLIAILAPEDLVVKASEVLRFATELGRESEETEFEYPEIQVDCSEAVADFIFMMRENLGTDALTGAQRSANS